ncbi:Hcp family type VI secretion system effector [Pseudomonas sp. LS1212]|uniref:Hcp family type VI secretion system effector n=1 Tax=Pseudomonas sp. LS1212 TaxID=2972478 RepID=UPI00215B8851|nr:Hcp family type VI secretion system effector [Pseudomonas sp. LS1212]UVJ43859.1 Hcp family type VI secretion system effector [Pseudomonas sp. LS1212]
MAIHSYMSIKGKIQGLISAGCSAQNSIGNKCQAGHEDEIMVLAYSHNMASGNNGTFSGGRGKHMPVVITKNIDKSTPLLASALHDGEEIDCKIDFYRISSYGRQEKYFTVTLSGGRIANLSVQVPHAINMGDAQPQEIMAIRYRDISWVHHPASTSAYRSWGNEGE